tara:strand:- start:2008 stop:3747 length:1740 start_codon:yes stop_codon:yes gene_type:complete
MIKIFKQITQLFNKDQKKSVIILLFLMLIASTLEFLSIGLIIPIVSVITGGEIINDYFNIAFVNDLMEKYPSDTILIILFVIFLSIFIIKFLFSVFFIYKKSYFIFSIRNNFSKRIFRSYLTRPFDFHQKNNTSKLAINCKYELDIFTSNIISPAMELLIDSTVAFSLFLLLFILEPNLTLVAVIFFISVIYSYQLILKKKTLIWGKERRHFDIQINKVLKEGLGSIKEIILNFKQNFFIQKLNHYLYRNLIVSVRGQLTTDIPRHFLEILAIFSFIMIFYFLKVIGYETSKILTLVSVFAAVSFKLLPAFNRMMSNIQRIRYGQPVITLLYDELNRNSNLENSINHFHDEKLNLHLKDSIVIKDLNFTYGSDSNTIFEKANLTINKGEFIGISGSSGAGKSTFLNLVSGLSQNYSGLITVNGEDISKFRNNWSRRVAYISQAPFFLDDSIKNNIAFAEEEEKIDINKIYECLKLSQLDKFINDLDDRIDTHIGEDGTRMSGGQLQRLAIARALYQDFDLIILDESLNALDNENEKKIVSVLDSLKINKTIILISHNLKTLDYCDKKYKIVEKNFIEYK